MKPWQPQKGNRPVAGTPDAIARECAMVVTIVASHRSVERRSLLASSRCTSETASARQLAMYLCHTMLDISLSAVGRYFGRHRTTVAHACVLVEDRREDGSALDSDLLDLEAEIERQRAIDFSVPIRPAFQEALRHG